MYTFIIDMSKEKEYIDLISSIEDQILSYTQSLKDVKKTATDIETKLIELKINKERTIELLRVLRNQAVNKEITDREKDIEEFKKKLPSILNKI